MMICGRQRGLPSRLDRTMVLPAEHELSQEDTSPNARGRRRSYNGHSLPAFPGGQKKHDISFRFVLRIN